MRFHRTRTDLALMGETVDDKILQVRRRQLPRSHKHGKIAIAVVQCRTFNCLVSIKRIHIKIIWVCQREHEGLMS